MPTTVVVTQVLRAESTGEFRLKGTIGGTAFVTGLKNFYFDPYTQPANALAVQMLNRYNTIVNSLSSGTIGILGRTINVTVQDNRISQVVFSSTFGTAVNFFDYDTLEISATVDGTVSKIHISQENYMEQQADGKDMGYFLGKKLFERLSSVNTLAPFTNTFSI